MSLCANVFLRKRPVAQTTARAYVFAQTELRKQQPPETTVSLLVCLGGRGVASTAAALHEQHDVADDGREQQDGGDARGHERD